MLKPRGRAGVPALWLILFLAISAGLLSQLTHRGSSYFRSTSDDPIPGGPPKIDDPSIHPITVLMAEAEEKWNKMLDGQSKTLEEAVREYRRRYGREPPKGFDVWYNWSVERGVQLIDEFDDIHRDLEPFWGLSPTQIESRRQELAATGSNRVFLMTIRDGLVDDEDGPGSSKKWEINKLYHALFHDVAPFLPDMNITVNLEDTPLVFTSWEERQRLIMAGREGVYAPDEEEISMPEEEIAKSPKAYSWVDLRAACHPDSVARRTVEIDAVGDDFYPNLNHDELDYQLPDSQGAFVYDHIREGDLCWNPKLKDIHGNFLVPLVKLPLKRNRLYPVFSWSTYFASSDITIPTTYRFDFSQYKLPTWQERTPKIAWRGSLTGMFIREGENIMVGQRFRMWTLVQSKFAQAPIFISIVSQGRRAYKLSTALVGKVVNQWSDVGPVSRWASLSGTKVGLMMENLYEWATFQSVDERNSFKMLLDLDGYGWSARYRELLRTGGAVVKAAAFHEAISDWLVPWYHFIPLSYEYHEYFSILNYFLGAEDRGQPADDDALRVIGERGRAWTSEHGSWDHHLSYLFRVGLEWGRVTSDDRASMTFDITQTLAE